MADQVRMGLAPNLISELGVARSFATSNIIAKVVNVEVGDKPAVSKVLRDGNEIVPPVVNDRLVGDLVDKLPPFPRLNIPRVLSQSVGAGTFVAKGTQVDLVLLLPQDINVGLLQNTHVDLANRPITQLLPLTVDPAVAPILANNDTPDTLSETDKATLQQKAGTLQVGIDENTPGKTTGNLFTALKGAVAFH
jgi:hypothetical protein